MKKKLIIMMFTFFLLCSVNLTGSSALSDGSKVQLASMNEGEYYANSTDIPTWSVGDTWNYAAHIYSETDNGTFDLTAQDLTITVNDIFTVNTHNQTWDTYHVVITGTLSGTFQASILTGDVDGIISGEAFLRRADLSLIYSNVSSSGIITALIFEYDYEITNINDYHIPFEYFDFPIVANEQWNTTSFLTMNSSIYVEDFMDNSSYVTTNTSGSVHCLGTDNITTAAGTFETYHLISQDNGSIETWYSEEVTSIARAVLIQNTENETNSVHLNMTSYSLNSSQITIDQSIIPTPSPIFNQVTISGNAYYTASGNPVDNTLVSIFVPIYDTHINTSTDSNGFYSISFPVNPFTDNSPTSYDLGSDGIITSFPTISNNFCQINTLVAVDTLSMICLVNPGWNFISIPFNTSMSPQDLLIEFNNSYLNWSEATTNQNPTNNPLINSYLFQWNRTYQTYGFVSTLQSGHGYWLYATEPCVLKSKLPQNQHTSFITTLKPNWNAIGIPQNQNMNKDDLIIVVNNTEYLWNDAVAASLVNNFIFSWNSSLQSYEFMNMATPGSAYWLYSFQQCILKHQ